jgi:hypothetical protein
LNIAGIRGLKFMGISERVSVRHDAPYSEENACIETGMKREKNLGARLITPSVVAGWARLAHRWILGVMAAAGMLAVSALAAEAGRGGVTEARDNPSPVREVRVSGSGTRPQLYFACCDQTTQQMEELFSKPEVIAELKNLQAGLAFAVTDFSPVRAQTARNLNAAGIPLVAWVQLPKEQGIYLTADDIPEAQARFEQFAKWTADNGLQWAGVGLDFEPDFDNMKGSRLRLVSDLWKHGFDGKRVWHARNEYGKLIRDLQSRGYAVQTYQLPFIVGERKARSTMVERLFGVVDVRGNLEVLMLYTSFARTFGPALIWRFGPSAQAIAVGSTTGGPGAPPLNWDELSRDLIVASHFSRVVGVYNLEGCVQQGFLPRMESMDWSQSVTISMKEINKVAMLGRDIGAALWITSHLAYFGGVVLIVAVLLIWRRVKRRTAG